MRLSVGLSRHREWLKCLPTSPARAARAPAGLGRWVRSATTSYRRRDGWRLTPHLDLAAFGGQSPDPIPVAPAFVTPQIEIRF
jgi:hypothetical protein